MSDEIPDFQTLMRPVLLLGQDGTIRTRDAVARLADVFELDEERRGRLLPSGRQTVITNRTHWAITYLSKAGAIERPQRGSYRTTERGERLLARHEDRIGMKELEVFDEFISFRDGAPGRRGATVAPLRPGPTAGAASETPDERIAAAVSEIHADLNDQLLDRILEGSPQAFEQLVVDLMVGMGFGGSEGQGRRIGRSNDGGIDGTIDEDALGLDVIYIQAKRYDPGNTVSRDKIQQFAGALVGRGASKGVFVTTSGFSRHAIDYAERVPHRIILIDGARLTRLMAQYGIGVRVERQYAIKKIDLDYFSADDV